MAKRVRGTTSRPGQRAPLQRTATRPPAKSATPSTQVAARPDELTDAEEANAAVLEAAIVAEERQHEVSSKAARAARATEPGRSVLDITAAAEYAYVARDVRRIAIVGGSLVTVLLALWVVASLTGFKLV